MCVFQCDAVAVWQYGLFGWENIGSTLRRDTGKPTLQIHAHNISDKPKGKKVHGRLCWRWNDTACALTQKHSVKISSMGFCSHGIFLYEIPERAAVFQMQPITLNWHSFHLDRQHALDSNKETVPWHATMRFGSSHSVTVQETREMWTCITLSLLSEKQ